MRTDKWIWAVRMVKSRTLATSLCRSGKVRVNQEKAKPAKSLTIADIVEVSQREKTQKYKVTGFCEKRVGFSIAQEYFEDLTPTIKTPDSSPSGKNQKTPENNLTENFRMPQKKDGRTSKKDKRARQKMAQNFFL